MPLNTAAPVTDIYGNVTKYLPGWNPTTQQWEGNPNTGQAYAPGQNTNGVGSHFEGNDLFSSTGDLIQKNAPTGAASAQPTTPNIQLDPNTGRYVPVPGSDLAKTALPLPLAGSLGDILKQRGGSQPTGGNGGTTTPPIDLSKGGNPPTGTPPPAVGPYSLTNLPPGFDLAKGSNDPNINKQIYGSDYFPGATAGPGGGNEAFGQFLLQNGWTQGKAAPLNAAQFSALSPADQGLYRTILAKYNASKTGAPGVTGGGNGTPPAVPPGPFETGFPPTPPSPNYSAGTEYENGLPPLRTNITEQEFRNTPGFQYEQNILKRALNDRFAASGRSKSTYADEQFANALNNLTSQTYNTQSQNILNREAGLNDLLYNRKTGLENTDFNRILQLLNLSYGASSPAPEISSEGSLASILAAAMGAGNNLAVGQGSSAAGLGANIGSLGPEAILLLKLLQGGA